MTNGAYEWDEQAVDQEILYEVLMERQRQYEKWGQQDLPDGTGPDLILRELPAFHNCVRADHLEKWARDRCHSAHEGGRDTYERILTEEWAETIAQRGGAKLREELIQVAAVAVAWIGAIDRRQESYDDED